MQFSIICGSHRKASESHKVGQYVATRIQSLTPGDQAHVIDLGSHPLPLWDEQATDEGQWPSVWQPIHDKLMASDAIVVVAPEWGGMVPAALKNFFLLANGEELGHKPAMIVAVSAGVSGSYPIAELRMSSYKNTKLVYLPDHIIVRNVSKVLNAQLSDDPHEPTLRTRIDFSLKILRSYGEALKPIRDSGITHHPKFAYGM